MDNDIKIDEENGKIYVVVEGRESTLNFRLVAPNIFDYYSTYVPASLRKRNIGSSLFLFALEYAKSQNKKIIPTCHFVKKFIDDHAEWSPIVSRL